MLENIIITHYTLYFESDTHFKLRQLQSHSSYNYIALSINSFCDFCLARISCLDFSCSALKSEFIHRALDFCGLTNSNYT